MSKHELTKRYILFIIGLFFSGLGVAFTKHGELGVSPLSSIANVILNSDEAFVKAIVDTTGLEFGNVKVAFDVICVMISIILSFLLFDGKIVGTREGTIIAALCTGFAVKFWTSHLRGILLKYLSED